VSPTKSAFDKSRHLKQRPRRPSFASPTKASLARNYPGLLSEREDLLAQGKQARAFVLGDKDTHSLPRPDATANVEGNQASSGAQRAHASEPQNVTPRARRTKAQNSPMAMENVSGEEADLPTPPLQRTAEEQDTPRRGILFSSPTKRPPLLKDPVKPSSLHFRAPSVQQDRSEIPLDEPIADELVDPIAEKKEEQSPDPELEKRKRARRRLLRDLKELESDVSRCTEEIVKIQGQSATHVLEPAEMEDLITFIDKISNSNGEADDGQPPAVSSLLCSFLPFATHHISPPRSKQTQQKPIASRRPLELDDPLPYLEMFTDFKMSTQLNLPRGRVFLGSNRVHQKHVVDMISPQKLLTASISMTIDVLTNSIIDLKVLRLPLWADRELGNFIRTRAEVKDLGSVGWAVGSYWSIAKKRAEFWHKCEISFRHLIPGWTSEHEENNALAALGKSIARKDLNRHLGRDELVLEDQHVLLKISWRITFDWTGEAESEISAEPAVPQVCESNSAVHQSVE
jgi:hypothetical protein